MPKDALSFADLVVGGSYILDTCYDKNITSTKADKVITISRLTTTGIFSNDVKFRGVPATTVAADDETFDGWQIGSKEHLEDGSCVLIKVDD